MQQEERTYFNRSVFPEKGEDSIIYIDTQNSLKYRWSLDRYVLISNPSISSQKQTVVIGGEGGVSDYMQLTNKPSINSVVLEGNKTLEELGIFVHWERVNTGSEEKPAWIIKPLRINENIPGVVSESFVSCRGVDPEAISSGLSRDELFKILMGRPEGNEYINIEYLEGLEDWLKEKGFGKPIVYTIFTAEKEGLVPPPIKLDRRFLTTTASWVTIEESLFNLMTPENGAFYVIPKTKDGSIVSIVSDGFISCRGVDSSASQGGGISRDDFETFLFDILTGDPSAGQYINPAFVDMSPYALKDWVSETVNLLTSNLNNLTSKVNIFLESENLNDTIDRWIEVENFLKGYTEQQTLANLLAAKADKTVSIIAGDGLTGGGTLETDRTLSLAASGVSVGTYTKVTVDIYGRVVRGTTLIESDIPTLSISKIENLQDNLDTLTDSIQKVSDRVKFFEDLFGVDSNGNVYVKRKPNGDARGFYSFGAISSKGWDGESVVGGVGSLSDLQDVVLSGLAKDQALVYDGSKWVNKTISVSGNYVTLDTVQTITAKKTFTQTICSNVSRIGPAFQIKQQVATDWAWIRFFDPTESLWWDIAVGGSVEGAFDALKFRYRSVDKMMITNDGKVSINSTKYPLYNLDVAGTLRSTGLASFEGNTIQLRGAVTNLWHLRATETNFYIIPADANGAITTLRPFWIDHSLGCIYSEHQIVVGSPIAPYQSNRASVSIVSKSDVPCDFWLGTNGLRDWCISIRQKVSNNILELYSRIDDKTIADHSVLSIEKAGNMTLRSGTMTASKFIVHNGTTNQFLKANGDLDSNVYLTTTAASTGYVTLTTIQTITAQKTFTAAPHFSQASGSPFTVGNTNKVINLNVDLLDGFHNGQLDAQHLTLAGDVASMGGDFNTLRYMGVYSYGTPPCNNNPGGTGAAGIMFQFSNNPNRVDFTIKSDWVSQLAAGTDKNLYYRMMTNNTWGAWNKLAFSSDLNNYVTVNTPQSISGSKIFSSTAYFSAAPGIVLNRTEGWRYIRFSTNTGGSTVDWDIATGGANGLSTDLEFRPNGTSIALVIAKNNTVTVNGNMNVNRIYMGSYSIYHSMVSSGGSASGSYLRNVEGKTIAGIGFNSVSNGFRLMYMGWGESPWEEATNFSVNSTDIKYKGKKVWHEGNDGSNSGLDADLLDGQHGSYYASQAWVNTQLGNYVKKTGDTMSGTLTLDTIGSSAPYLTFRTQLYIGNATDTNNTVNQGSIRTIGGISASLSIWSGKNLIATGEVSVVSDIRTKSNIQDLKFRGSVRPVTFIKNKRESIGFIAQEVQKLYPELVMRNPDGILSLNYGAYTAVLQSQLDIHEDEISRLKRRVSALESENRELNRKLSSYGK